MDSVIENKRLLTWSLWSHCINIWMLYNCIIILSVCYNSREQVNLITIGIFPNKCYSKNFIRRSKAEPFGIALLNLTGIWYPVLLPLALPILTEFCMIFFSHFCDCWENAWNYASFLILQCSQFMIFLTLILHFTTHLIEAFLLKNSRIHYRLCSEEFINFIFVGVCMHMQKQSLALVTCSWKNCLKDLPSFKYHHCGHWM